MANSIAAVKNYTIILDEVFTVLQVGESYFLAIDEGRDPTTLYEDEVELVNPPLDPQLQVSRNG